jgi:hypothetical protein
VQLLEMCAYLAPEPIPLDLFTAHRDLLPEPLSLMATDQLAFTDTVAVLVDYSLAKRSPAGLQLHRLVQARRDYPLPGTPLMPHAAGLAGHPLLVAALVLLRVDAPGTVVFRGC